MNWREYAFAMLGFSAAGMLLTYGIERLQAICPGTRKASPPSDPIWPGTPPPASPPTPTGSSTRPKATMSYLTEMVGLATHNFWSAAVGIVVAVALIRGIKRTTSGTIGNFWVDMTRSLLYILLAGIVIYALLLVAQGVPQNLKPTRCASARAARADQTIGQGPVASQEAIKMLGTNGGGFFNANSAHPFENPTPFSNFLQIFPSSSFPPASPTRWAA
jgi:K+-transporting ATPase ATPase A chain